MWQLRYPVLTFFNSIITECENRKGGSGLIFQYLCRRGKSFSGECGYNFAKNLVRRVTTKGVVISWPRKWRKGGKSEKNNETILDARELDRS